MTLQYKKNNSRSTLNASVSGAATTLLVTNLVSFPDTAPFTVTVWNKTTYPNPGDDPNSEIMLVTAISSGNTLTVTRAQESTLARAHASGDAIELLITAGQLNDYVALDGRNGGQAIIGGISSSDILALKSNSQSVPRTARTTTDMLTVFGDNFTYPSGSSAAFNAIIHSPAITGIDVASPNINPFQIGPSYTYTISQSWGLAPKSGLHFAPTFISGVGASGSDSAIFQAVNAQPQLNLSDGPRTWSNLWAIAGDPRMLGTAGTLTNMYCFRARGNTISGTTVTNVYAFISDFSHASGATVGTYNGVYISPTLTGTITDFIGLTIASQTAPASLNIGIRQLGTSMHNRFVGYIGIGADSTPSHPLVITKTRTETSGAISNISSNLTLAPASNSTSTVYGSDNVSLTSTGSSNPATTFVGGRFLSHRNVTDSGSITTMRGLQLQTLNCAALSTGQGIVTTLLEGAYFQAFDNSSTTTATTTVQGVLGNASISSNVVASRVITNLIGGRFEISLGAGSTSTTVTNALGVYIDPFTNSLARTGTVTNGYGLQIGAWLTAGGLGSGITYTNPPEQIHLDSMSVASSIGIRQIGSTPHNRFNGNVMIGSDATPTNALTVVGIADFSTGIVPDANDGAYLGTTALQWSDLFLAEGGVINWDNGDVTITQTGNTLAFAGGTVYTHDGSVVSTSATAGVGYATGAGSTVTQATSKATGVTINAVTGTITMNNAALGNNAEVGFTVTNSAVAATDIPILAIKSGATADAYHLHVDAVAAGSFRISIGNVSGGSLSEAVVISFAIIKGVAA